MKASEIREMTTREIKEKLQDQKLNYSKMKMAHGVSPLENPVNLKYTRKDIARLATELHDRQISEEQ